VAYEIKSHQPWMILNVTDNQYGRPS